MPFSPKNILFHTASYSHRVFNQDKQGRASYSNFPHQTKATAKLKNDEQKLHNNGLSLKTCFLIFNILCLLKYIFLPKEFIW